MAEYTPGPMLKMMGQAVFVFQLGEKPGAVECWFTVEDTSAGGRVVLYRFSGVPSDPTPVRNPFSEYSSSKQTVDKILSQKNPHSNGIKLIGVKPYQNGTPYKGNVYEADFPIDQYNGTKLTDTTTTLFNSSHVRKPIFRAGMALNPPADDAPISMRFEGITVPFSPANQNSFEFIPAAGGQLMQIDESEKSKWLRRFETWRVAYGK